MNDYMFYDISEWLYVCVSGYTLMYWVSVNSVECIHAVSMAL